MQQVIGDTGLSRYQAHLNTEGFKDLIDHTLGLTAFVLLNIAQGTAANTNQFGVACLGKAQNLLSELLQNLSLGQFTLQVLT